MIYVLIYGNNERRATLGLFSTSPWLSFWCCSYSFNSCHCLATLVWHHADILLKFSLEHFFLIQEKLFSSTVWRQRPPLFRTNCAMTWWEKLSRDIVVGRQRGEKTRQSVLSGGGRILLLPLWEKETHRRTAWGRPLMQHPHRVGGREGREMWLSGNTSVIKLPLISSSFRRLPLWV